MSSNPFDFLRRLLSKKAISEQMSHYHFDGRMVAATNGIMTGAHPSRTEMPRCLVRGEHIESALRAVTVAPHASLDRSTGILTLTAGRFRAKMPVVEHNLWEPTKLEGEWTPIPRHFTSILKDILPFAAENADVTAWIGCIAIADGTMWATDRQTMARSNDPLAGAEHVNALVPRAAVEFILGSEEGLESWCITENAIGFGWDNGAWMHSSLVQGKWPIDTGRKLLSDEVMAKSTVDVTDEWREALERTLDVVGTSHIELKASSIESNSGDLFVEMTIDNLLPEGCPPSKWKAESLRKMSRIAETWQPAEERAPFVGQRISGMMVRHVD